MLDRDEALIRSIYEAAALPDRWPAVLQTIADRVGARGAVLFAAAPGMIDWIASPAVLDDVADYIAGGWAADTEHSAPLRQDLYPGFRAESDYRSIEEIERLPVHAEFLDPRGYIAGVGTVIQGADDDMLQLAFEGFASHPLAAAAAPVLDGLRPHFGRALGLSAVLRRGRATLVVDTLALAGLAAAVVDSGGRLRAVNAAFEARYGNRFIDRPNGVRFADAFFNRQIAKALVRVRAGEPASQSVPLPGGEDRPSSAVQIVPLVGRARELCDSDGVLLIGIEAANASLPDPSLLRILYDLTPAEALMARRIGEGMSLAAAAQAGSIGVETARTHLRRVFGKTGVRRQADLVRLLLGASANPNG